MAEFSEVMKQAKRMCKEFGNDCAGCGLADSHCPLGPIPENMDADFVNVERIVMDWAKEHPEPVYPTWKEWQKENFPTAHDVLHPCSFMEREEVERNIGIECGLHSCNDCARKPIPADIAEKLRIKPISLGDSLPVCHGDAGALTAEDARKRLLPYEEKPRAICLGYSSHDCESRYKCPVCGALFGSWDIHEEKNENVTKRCCPDCKTELSWPE